jgi:NADPH2 dehydrogenase
MKMKNPVPQFEHIMTSLVKSHPNLAYAHFIEPDISGNTTVAAGEGETNDPFRKIWGSRPFISCGNHTRESAIEAADQKGDIVAFGRPFMANVSRGFH